MTALSLTLAYLRQRGSAAWLNLLLMALGVAMIFVLIWLRGAMQERIARDAGPVNIVVSSSGSPMQIILSSIFHIDVPTGNLPYDKLEMLRDLAVVKEAIPLGMGDNFRGFRIVGTEPAYIGLYGGTVAEGREWSKPMEAVLGSAVARETGLAPGMHLTGEHGLFEGGTPHAGHPYEVTGVLQPTGTVIDRLILTDLRSVWQVHDHHHDNEPVQKSDDGHDHHAHEEEDHVPHEPEARPDEQGDITAILVTLRNPAAIMALPQMLRGTAGVEVAVPVQEVMRLQSLIMPAAGVIEAAGWLLALGAMLNILISLYQSLHDRRYDIALMRSFGASRLRISLLVMAEQMAMCLAAILLGMLLTMLAAAAIQSASPAASGLAVGMKLSYDMLVTAAMIIAAVFLLAFPAVWRGVNRPVAEVLAQR